MAPQPFSILLAAVLTIGGIGFISGFGLALAADFFGSKIDPKIKLVMDALPGVNCGACGFPSCELAAEAIVKHKAEISICRFGGKETLQNLTKILSPISQA